MASINNLQGAAEAALASATLVDVTGQEGVSSFEVTDGSLGEDVKTVLTSSESNVELGDDGEGAVLTGTSNLNVDGGDGNDTIVGNDGDNNLDSGDGNDNVATGGGDNTIAAGDGDDTVTVSGSGTNVIDGGDGNDLFIINSSSAGSTNTFTGLNVGDKVRVVVQDTNGDGKLDFDDIQGTSEVDGNVVFTLQDGTSFTLEGVSEESALNGDIAYDIVPLDDGSGFEVVLRASLDDA